MHLAVSVASGVVDHDGFEEMAAYAIECERMGIHSAWSTESWWRESVVPLAFLAARTSRIGLGTSIMVAPARTPAMTAITAMDLHEATRGRFMLGLGASGPNVVEGLHGVRFAPAVQRLREIIEIVRMYTAGERVSYQGQVYQIPLPGGEGVPLRTRAKPARIPIYLASLSPKSLELTGELADGWIGTSFIPEVADLCWEPMERGAQRAGRTRKDIQIQVIGQAVEFTDDLDRTVARAKKALAFTMGAMGSRRRSFYADAFTRQGYGEEAAAIRAAWARGDEAEAAAIVPDKLVYQTRLLGTDAMVKDRLRAYRDAGVDVLQSAAFGGTLDQRLASIARLKGLVDEVTAEMAPAPERAGAAPAAGA